MSAKLIFRRTLARLQSSDDWLDTQGLQIRTTAWFPNYWIGMPDKMARIPGVLDELARHGLQRWKGKYAPLRDGGYLLAVWERRPWYETDRVWVFRVDDEGAAQVQDSGGGGVPPGAPPLYGGPMGARPGPSGGGGGGLPPGAPPANAGDALARLRWLVRRRTRGN